ncbi:MAG: NfeD family protein [Armatimonadetes bacterium]|nr:NfeD family protein [Armatimonadota bacterium]
MIWWGWIVLGFILLAAEILAFGGFYFFFFGIGALMVGMLALLNVAGPAWIQWLLFSLFSLMTMFMLRRRLLATTVSPLSRPDRDDFIGISVLAVDDLSPEGAGRVEMRGTIWSARNIGITPILRGERCMVMEVEGLTLGVRKDAPR